MLKPKKNNKLKNDQKRLERTHLDRTSGQRKQFSGVLHREHDNPGVEAVLRHLERSGVYAKQNPDQFGPDIIVWEGYQPGYYIEVARRSGWKAGRWPPGWEKVRLEERKLHLFVSDKKKNKLSFRCEYWIVRLDGQAALRTTEEAIVGCLEANGLAVLENSQVAKGERFLEIPLGLIEQLELLGEHHDTRAEPSLAKGS